MITLYDGGAYLINGNELVKDNQDAVSIIKEKTGKIERIVSKTA